MFVQIESQPPLPIQCHMATWSIFVCRPRRLLRSVIHSTSARNDLNHLRQPNHQHSGKYLRNTMRTTRWVIQYSIDFLHLFAYPFYQAPKFYTNVIDGSTRTPRRGSEPRVQHIFLVYLMTLFTVAFAHNPQPVVDLNNGFSNYAIHFGEKTFNLVYDNDGIVMTTSNLVRRHQLMSISRVSTIQKYR